MGCPIPSANILLADGRTKPAGALEVGDKLDTLHEKTLKRGSHEVTYVEIIDSEVLELNFSGEILHCSPTHKLYLPKEEKWIEVKDLKKKDIVSLLDGDIAFTSRTKLDDGQVVVIKVDKAHTYICEGILSHNKGNTTYHAPPPPPPDTTFQDYLKHQSEREEKAKYRNWADKVQRYQADKSRQSSGREGWADFQEGVKSQLRGGLITYNDARSQLQDYTSRYNLAPGSVLSPGQAPNEAGSGTTLPTYETPGEWQNWSVAGAQNRLTDFYQNELLPGRRDTGIKSAYQELLGREATADELQTAKDRFGSGYYSNISDVKDSLTAGSEYKDKFQTSYLDNYYDTMFGDELRDTSGQRTGMRQFRFDDTLLPSYSGDLKDRTKITLPDYKDSFVGTPGEIDFQLDNIRESRKFLYSAGLTNLQGEIDKETQKLKNEGGKEITRISKEGDIYGNLVNAFNF